jgi:hypothetical protein
MKTSYKAWMASATLMGGRRALAAFLRRPTK